MCVILFYFVYILGVLDASLSNPKLLLKPIFNTRFSWCWYVPILPFQVYNWFHHRGRKLINHIPSFIGICEPLCIQRTPPWHDNHWLDLIKSIYHGMVNWHSHFLAFQTLGCSNGGNMVMGYTFSTFIHDSVQRMKKWSVKSYYLQIEEVDSNRN